MKRSALHIPALLICLLLSGKLVNAQTIQSNSKPNVSVDYERLKRIDTLVNDYISKNYLTGAVTLVVKDNQLI